LEELINEVNQAECESADKSMGPIAFTIYYLLKKSEKANPEELVVEMTTSFDQYPHWRSSPAQERSVGEGLYKTLLKVPAENKRTPSDITSYKSSIGFLNRKYRTII
jgi:hypothetical protein